MGNFCSKRFIGVQVANVTGDNIIVFLMTSTEFFILILKTILNEIHLFSDKIFKNCLNKF